ncbi:hypothetical protein D3870_21045 [Noviherbaspirillum cavernae]|uniref:Integrase n=1 Tax=Noviherbaspirillum cavernae TaxID=2320862 RepID=A0A418WW02_9BURK|nr:phage integrase family protein [Noviherbaspirillum cavernae]RJF96870.1 hypothetical protein D3870_21045 [Noviherbaspirillum cavernae]
MRNFEGWRGTVVTRVAANHLAFLRGYLEGLDLAALSARYLETAVAPDPELRVAKATLRWIRAELMVTARRRGHFPDARLILIEPEALRQSARRAIPSLEEFREQRDPHELYTEAELIEIFHEEFGDGAANDRRSLRNERLRRRQLNALLELEKLLGAPPAMGDQVAGWLAPTLARRLHSAGLTTLADLVTAINGRGFRWWIHVPRVGKTAAAQVVAWLKTESVAQALGVPLGIQASVKANEVPTELLRANRAAQTAIVPLEHLHLTRDLDGSEGMNRGTQCRIQADNDIAAIYAWLALKPAHGSTWRSYRKEAERFLLWAVIERRRPLSSISAADCLAYRDFLGRIDKRKVDDWPFRVPAVRWCAPRGTKRWSELWRPFEGALSPRSRDQAFTILSSLCDWLTRQDYLAANPWSDVPRQDSLSHRSAPERGLPEFHWNLLQDFLESRPRDAKSERLRFVLALCRETGLRASELVHATVGALHCSAQAGDAEGAWLLNTITGRQVPVSRALLASLDRYLAHRGLIDRSNCSGLVCLIARLPACRNPRPARRTDGPELSTNALYQLLKQFFHEAAAVQEAQYALSRDGDARGSEGETRAGYALAMQTRRASTEWLRRTCSKTKA